MTFKRLIEGKESKFEEKLNVDHPLLRRLQQHKLITNHQRCKIEVNFVIVLHVLMMMMMMMMMMCNDLMCT